MRPKHPWVRGRWTISRETEQSGPACCVSSVAWVYSGGLCALVKFPTQAPGVPYRPIAADEARAEPRRGVPPCSARRSPSQHVGRSLPASVGAPAPPRRPSTLSAAMTSPPLCPDPARCFDCPVDPTPAAL